MPKLCECSDIREEKVEAEIDFKFDDENSVLIDNIEITANENTKSTVIIKYTSNQESENYHDGIIKAKAEKGSELNIILINLMNTKSNNFLAIENDFEENAKINYTIVDFGGKHSITNYYSNLQGDSCDNQLNTIYLGKENYNIFTAYDGEQALKVIQENEIHLVILDVMMPKKDGIETLSEIRKDKNIPVIILSAKSEDIDKINGLNVGADDYVTKPFNPVELIARVNALIRRYTKLGGAQKNEEPASAISKENIIRVGELVINDDLKQVVVDGKEVKLTPTEYNILKFLAKNKGRVFSIEEIYTNVWEGECYAAENVIAVHIRHIREKIEINPKEPKYLKVIWGVGYKIA